MRFAPRAIISKNSALNTMKEVSNLLEFAGHSLTYFFQIVEDGIASGAVYALVALGYTLVYGIIELINFAHGDVFMASTVVVLTIIQSMHLSSTLGPVQLVLVLIMLTIVAMLVSGVLNVTIERLAYRPLRKAPRLAPLISAIGVSFILEAIALFWKGSQARLTPDLFPNNGIQLGLVKISYADITIVLAAIALMVGLERFIRLTKMGRAMRATAQDPEAAALMGVNINQTISFAFLIGGALAGAAAVIWDVHTKAVIWNEGLSLGLFAFTAAVLGGIGNINGAVLGGFLIGLIQALSIGYIQNGSSWGDAIVFGILVLILILRPSGLLGQQVPDKV